MLHATDLTLARGGVPVLTGLSFDLEAGQALILRTASFQRPSCALMLPRTQSIRAARSFRAGLSRSK
tara:strand:+ start:371 stop:571 length:201 start_codon:yes stop_codon:yes gene_type:complete